MALTVGRQVAAVATTAGLLVGGLEVQHALAQTSTSSPSADDSSNDDGSTSTTRDAADCPHDDDASQDT
jgi:hypothetical protein